MTTDWYPIVIWFILSTLISSGVGYFVWFLQKKSSDKREEEREKRARALEKDLRIANEEKARIAEGHSELVKRVAMSEALLGQVKQQLSLLDQQAQPLFEAAKIRLIEALTHPDEEFKVPDELLKLTLGPEGYITPELATLLKEREVSTHPSVTPEEKLAAAILPEVVQLAAMESKVIGPLTKQIVSSPAARPNEESK